MLSEMDNMLLTQVSKGKPMGELFRRYWLPAMAVEELPYPNCPPVRVKLLGEFLIAFRSTSGEIGLVEEYCPHRKASLYFGRNEENGIRCVFHGWKFDKDGKCMDMPTEPAGSKLKEKACITSYPCKEYGGIIWTYMGPKEHMPEFPEFEFGSVASENRIVTKWHQKCSYVQGIEANMDSAHLSFLHVGGFGKLLKPDTNVKSLINDVSMLKIEIVHQDYGFISGAGRDLGDGNTYWRASHFVMPCLTLIPPSDDSPRHVQAWVPMDDVNCYSFAISWQPERALNHQEIMAVRNGHMIHAQVRPGSLEPVANIENDYLINRELQATGINYTGITGLAAQDAAVLESTRGIPDRTTEMLGTSDIAIIQMRRALMESARKLSEGKEVMKLDGKRVGKLRSGAGVIANHVNYYEAMKETLEVETLASK